MKYLILILCLFYCGIEGKQMSKHIKVCSRRDPKLNECFMRNANLAMEYIAKGDPEYEINALISLKWENFIYVEAPTKPPVKLYLYNITVYEMENMKVIKPNIDLEAKKIQFTLVNPLIIWKLNYKVSVEIDHFKHEVEGKGQIDLADGEYLMTFNFNYYLKNGVKHAKITNETAKFENIELNFDLENLESNKVIQKYWEKAQKYFVNDMILEKCAKTTSRYINNVFKHVPFDLVFTP